MTLRTLEERVFHHDNYSTIRFPDLNGDGLADVCGRGIAGIDCALSTGTGFGLVATWQASFSDANGWNSGPQYYSTIQFPDLNGDGVWFQYWIYGFHAASRS
jgi:hypothetical protein